MVEKYIHAAAFAPANITGFFSIADDAEELRKCGSIGAGICLSKGCLSRVSVKKGGKKKNVEVYLNGKKSEALTTTGAIENLLGDSYGAYQIKIENTIQLPFKQGFGISGAGALSSALAVARAFEMDVTFYDVVEAAHNAEIECKTGLGDIVAQASGGVTLRRKAGIPPYGFIDKLLEPKKEIIVAIIGRDLETKKILSNTKAREKISQQGEESMKKLCETPSLESFVDISYEFAENTGLMSDEAKNALSEIAEYGKGSVSMLGRSIFVVPNRVENKKKIINKLKNYGEIFVCDIDNCGARYM